MTLANYQNSVLANTGVPAAFIAVAVVDSDTQVAATIYSDKDGATPIASLITDVNGYFQFFVAAGTYDITFGSGDSSITWDRVLIGTFQGEDFEQDWRGQGSETLTAATAALQAALGPNAGADGRSIFEAAPVTQADQEFTAGGTFTVDPENPSHRYLKVHDTSTPLTANMTLALAPADADWLTGETVTVIKGDMSDFTITVSGFDADGLGTHTLRQSRQGIICVYQSTDSANGPGASGQKFERGPQFYGSLADVATSGDYTDLANPPVLGTASAQAVAYFLQPSQVAAGAITAATGTLDLTGTNGQVLTVDGSGNIAPASPAATLTLGGVAYTDLAAGANVAFAADGDGTATINVSSGTATLGDGDYDDIIVSGTGTVLTVEAALYVSAQANNDLTASPKFWRGTQAEYDALTPTAGEIYCILEA